MIYQSILHCENDNIRTKISKSAQKAGLEIISDGYPLSIQVKGEAIKHDSFLSSLKNNKKVVILRDNKHPDTKTNCCKPYYKQNFKPNEVAAPTGQYGRTATWYAKYYNFPETNAKPVIAIISLGGGYQIVDIVTYWKKICGLTTFPTIINIPVGQAKLPDYKGTGEDMENTLDLEICGGACPNATLLFISAPNSFYGFYSAFATAINGANGYKPSIISVSWGSYEPAWGASYLTAFNNLFAVAVSKGITILVASGDNGSSDGYTANNLPNVDFPASSPNVIAVGGTTVTTNDEILWSYNPTYKWGAGSGCSSLFPMPVWQLGLISLPTNTKPTVNYLAGKRIVPDISLSADPLNGYTIYMDGKTYISQIGGTSCAAPLMSAYLGRLNLAYTGAAANYLYKVFANPITKNTCYKDILIGNNDNIPGSVNLWKTGPGFDYCSGIGSINGTNLYNALKSIGLSAK